MTEIENSGKESGSENGVCGDRTQDSTESSLFNILDHTNAISQAQQSSELRKLSRIRKQDMILLKNKMSSDDGDSRREARFNNDECSNGDLMLDEEAISLAWKRYYDATRDDESNTDRKPSFDETMEVTMKILKAKIDQLIEFGMEAFCSREQAMTEMKLLKEEVQTKDIELERLHSAEEKHFKTISVRYVAKTSNTCKYDTYVF